MTEKKRIQPRTPGVCPVCGEKVPRGALACPECGADHSSGWREDAATYDGVELPDDDFNYDAFVKREFGAGAKPPRLKMVRLFARILMLVAFCFLFVYPLWSYT